MIKQKKTIRNIQRVAKEDDGKYINLTNTCDKKNQLSLEQYNI